MGEGSSIRFEEMHADPFDVLGLAPTFDIEPGLIRSTYLEEMARIHPDLARGDDEAARRAARLNQAREVLDNPETRAGALLRRLGGAEKDADKSLPSGFLMDMMQTREAIEESVPEERPRWHAWAAKEREGYIARLSRHFKAAMPDPSPEHLGEIRRELNAWRYIERLIEQVDPGREDASGRAQD